MFYAYIVITSKALTPQTISLSKHTGNIFAAPDHTVLIHFCNARGIWGAGIAVPFNTAYPKCLQCHYH